MKYKYSKDEFEEAVRTSYSKAEVARKLGITGKGGNIKTIKRKIEEYGLDTSHFTGQR